VSRGETGDDREQIKEMRSGNCHLASQDCSGL